MNKQSLISLHHALFDLEAFVARRSDARWASSNLECIRETMELIEALVKET
jgi:hypothetical protein